MNIPLDILVLHCPRYTPIGMYYRIIEENAVGSEKKLFRKGFLVVIIRTIKLDLFAK